MWVSLGQPAGRVVSVAGLLEAWGELVHVLTGDVLPVAGAARVPASRSLGLDLGQQLDHQPPKPLKVGFLKVDLGTEGGSICRGRRLHHQMSSND